jgi:hypothetical protein
MPRSCVRAHQHAAGARHDPPRDIPAHPPDLMAANPLAPAGLIVLIVAVQLQVRVVEEPCLTRVHDQAYLAYTGRIGWSGSGLGSLPQSRHDPSGDKLDRS